MSLWDKYLAPGDIRHQRRIRHEQAAALQIQQDLALAKEAASQPERPRLDASTRQRRQDGLLFGGVAFTLLSLFITRRALAKKSFASAANPDAASKVDGPLEAAQALGLATLNVFAFAMAGIGGVMKYFDVADIEDLREGYRRALGYDVHSGESAADKEIEGWIADVLARRDGTGNLREGVAEKILELELQRKKEEELKAKRGWL
jgi:hypothetical protein